MQKYYEMNMPKRYKELSEDEMEYDGGFPWAILGAVVSLVMDKVSEELLKSDNGLVKSLGAGLGAASIAVGVVSGGAAITAAVTAVTTTMKVVHTVSAVKNILVDPIKDSVQMGLAAR